MVDNISNVAEAVHIKKITVTDISEGMVNDARRNIECAIREASFTLNSNISQKFEYGMLTARVFHMRIIHMIV